MALNLFGLSGAIKASPDVSHSPMNYIGYCSFTGEGYEIREDISANTVTVYIQSNPQIQRRVSKQEANDLISGTVSIEQIITGMTSDEKVELSRLKEEKNKWKHREKLKIFQQMPAKFRQAVVDEAIIRQKLKEMNNIDDSEFPDSARLSQLELKDWTRIAFNTYRGGYGHPITPDIEYKYTALHNEFTFEELMEAHASATLEEELLGTDSRNNHEE